MLVFKFMPFQFKTLGNVVFGPGEPAGISVKNAFDEVEIEVLEHAQLYRQGRVVKIEVSWLGLIGSIKYRVEGVYLNRVVFVAVAAVEGETEALKVAL